MKAEVSNRIRRTIQQAKIQSKFKVPLLLMACLASLNLQAATTTIYSENFDSYSGAATSLTDTANANPATTDINYFDDNPLGGVNGSGLQLVNWVSHSGPNSLLLRPGTQAQIYLKNAKSGSRYQLDFWANIARGPTSDRSFYVLLQGEGADYNGKDYIAYRTARLTNDCTLNLYDGVSSAPAWLVLPAQAATNQWQHHRIVVDTMTQMVSVYLDDMVTPVTTSGRVARSEVAVPTILNLFNEGNSADDGWWAIDDISLTVDGSIDLTNTFKEGFESYSARTSVSDNANPGGPWITVETDGIADGGGRPAAPGKVQVVDSSVIAPHSGSKCLKLEGGQRAGVSLAWGQTPLSDVQITWWSLVPTVLQSTPTSDAIYLRASLYSAEGGNTFSGDTALMGYGIRRQSGTNCGSATGLIYFTSVWADSGAQFTPDVWEEYRLTTYNSKGTYSIVKNPSSANPIVVLDQAPFIAVSSTWGPAFMMGWSSSTVTNHPPVYLDDIEVKSLVANPAPQPSPYAIQFNGNRFTNVTVLNLGGPIGAVAVDPRDKSSIIFTTDAAAGGGIYRAAKLASGNWAAEPIATATPIIGGLASPSGLAIEPGNGNIWWTHDFAASLMRLKSPWSSNTPEQVVADFVAPANNPAVGAWLDDDTTEVIFPPSTFSGSLGNASQLVVMDRGVDFNLNNAFFLVDPSTSSLMQTNYDRYLYGPSTTGMGWSNIVGVTTLQQSGEIVSLNQDAQVTAVNGDGSARVFWPNFYSDPTVHILPATIAGDPSTGRIWIGDDLWDQVWSCAPDGTAEQLELTFALTDTTRPDRQLVMHSPGAGMTFSPDGKFMVMSDNSMLNGGGRLLIFHNEPFAVPSFTVTNVSSVGQQVQLSWSAAGAVKYSVQRATSLAGAVSFQTIGTNLTARQFTTTNVVGGSAFYRVVASPSTTP